MKWHREGNNNLLYGRKGVVKHVQCCVNCFFVKKEMHFGSPAHFICVAGGKVMFSARWKKNGFLPKKVQALLKYLCLSGRQNRQRWNRSSLVVVPVLTHGTAWPLLLRYNWSFSHRQLSDAGVTNLDAQASNLTWYPMESTKKKVLASCQSFDAASSVW